MRVCLGRSGGRPKLERLPPHDRRRWATVVDLGTLLRPWRLARPAFTEIAHRGRASRTWWVDSERGRFVAKLTFDRRCFVEPGLRVAAAVAETGIATGCPVPTEDGDLCLEVDRGSERPWTIALLEAALGVPLTPSVFGAEVVAGQVLGRVHAFLAERSERQWVPADLLVWLAGHADETANGRAADLVSSIAAHRHRLGCSVVYGDPSPEILVAADGTAALIDWGTPSWGPQIYDVAVWLRWLGERPGGGSEREGRLLANYGRPIEREMLELFGRCVAAFGS